MRVSFKTAKIATVLGAVLAVLAGMGAAAVSATTASSSWGQTDYNAALSRANLTEQTITSSTVGKVQYLRGVASPLILPGQDTCAGGYGVVAPVLTGGNMYAITEARLTKYNPATGGIIWRRTPDPQFTRVFEALSVSGGLVVVGGFNCTSESESQGYIQAFNASTGAPVWSTTTALYTGHPLHELVVSSGYVVSSASGVYDEIVTVRKLTTGAVVWSNSGSCFGSNALVVAQRVIWVSDNCDTHAAMLTARNLATGTLAWSMPGAWQVQRGDSGLAAGHHLYATSPDGTVVALDPLTGNTQYSLAGATKVLAVDNSQVYADCGSLGVCAYSTSSGSQQWSAQPGYTANLAAEAGGVLYLDQGLALNTATGQTIIYLWGYSPAATALAIGDGRIAAVTDPRVLDLYGLPGS